MAPVIPIDLQEAHALYRERGWYIADVFSSEEIDELNHHIARFYAGEQDRVLDVALSREWTPEKGNVMRVNDYLSLRMNAVRKALQNSSFGRIAAALADTSSIRLFHDQLFCKPPYAASTGIGWHTDKPYWPTCSSDNMLTAWIPLQDCPQEMGPLVIVEGSHRWFGIPNSKTFHNQDMTSVEPQVRSAFERARKVPMTLKRGQVSFHHCWALHGSYPNTSDRARISLSVHLQDAANRHRGRLPNGAEAVHKNDLLCRRDVLGTPDYGDPSAFPIFWQAEAGMRGGSCH